MNNSKIYNYKIHYKSYGSNKKVVVLNQIPCSKGEQHAIEIPEDDLDNVIMKLSNAKNIVDEQPASENLQKMKTLKPNIIQTLVTLFLSGISIADLSKQYNYSEELIKFHLEEKGIILF